MADPKALGLSDFSNRNMLALARDLPRYTEIVNQQILPNEQAQLDAAKVISPQYYDLLTNLYSTYAPELARIGNKIDLENLAGAGTQRAGMLAALDRSLDPEYYKTREATAGKLGELLGSIDLNAPNAEAERLVNQEVLRSGNITPSATQTTANALGFGNELQKRRNALGQAISAATQFMPGSRTGFSATALPQTSAQGQAMGQFGGVQRPGNQAYAMGSEMFGTNAAYQGQKSALDMQRESTLDKINQTVATAGNAIGSVAQAI